MLLAPGHQRELSDSCKNPLSYMWVQPIEPSSASQRTNQDVELPDGRVYPSESLKQFWPPPPIAEMGPSGLISSDAC